ncbi:MAG: hypothetical protein DMD78_00225 [Candidatus Rokuibacteriota bacterium]|nr:MAG: hypothetical protein DMD78_00225 [Candidatus Rokubacteria bacterium]
MRGIILSAVLALLVVLGQPVGASIVVGDTVPCDFVTGGGFIVGSGSPTSSLAAGAKANFAVGGGVRNGEFWGHLEYNDHSKNPPMQVHGTAVTGYFLGTDTSKPNDRVITGTARVNGVDGFTYMVEVNDVREPGRGIDEFSIELLDANGAEIYAAGFTYGDGPIAGGNIQLHPGNGSSTPPAGFTCA